MTDGDDGPDRGCQPGVMDVLYGEIENTESDAYLADGRVKMRATDVTSTLRVYAPEMRPLSADERHATLKITADGVSTTIDLDGRQLDALRDVVKNVANRSPEDDL